jgi:hypothetical protein
MGKRVLKPQFESSYIQFTSYTTILVALGKISMSYIMDDDIFAYEGPRTLPQEIPASSLKSD